MFRKIEKFLQQLRFSERNAVYKISVASMVHPKKAKKQVLV